MSKSQGFQINWLASTGSALGAVSSAVLLSTLGAAGTIFGAALGSLIITVGGSIYTQSLQKTKDRVINVRVGEKRTIPPQGAGATMVDSSAPSTTAVEAETTPKKPLPWKRIIALSVGLFVAAMAIILVFEMTAGRPVSSFTGGSDTESGTTFSKLASTTEQSDESDADMTDEDPTDTTDVQEPRGGEPADEAPIEEKPADPPPADQPPAEAPPAESNE